MLLFFFLSPAAASASFGSFFPPELSRRLSSPPPVFSRPNFVSALGAIWWRKIMEWFLLEKDNWFVYMQKDNWGFLMEWWFGKHNWGLFILSERWDLISCFWFTRIVNLDGWLWVENKRYRLVILYLRVGQVIRTILNIKLRSILYYISYNIKLTSYNIK